MRMLGNVFTQMTTTFMIGPHMNKVLCRHNTQPEDRHPYTTRRIESLFPYRAQKAVTSSQSCKVQKY